MMYMYNVVIRITSIYYDYFYGDILYAFKKNMVMAPPFNLTLIL